MIKKSAAVLAALSLVLFMVTAKIGPAVSHGALHVLVPLSAACALGGLIGTAVFWKKNTLYWNLFFTFASVVLAAVNGLWLGMFLHLR